MSTTKAVCPKCYRPLDEMGRDYDYRSECVLFHCKECAYTFAIVTGLQIDDMYNDIVEEEEKEKVK